MMSEHYVYYLYYADGTLADIGRSKDPEWRRRFKQRRHGCEFNIEITSAMTFEAACQFELEELRKHTPPLMRRLVSSPGMLGKRVPHSKAHIAAIVAGRVGYKHTAETKSKISKRHLGKRHSVAARERMSLTRAGQKRTEVTKLRMSAAAYERWDRQHLVQSGWGHPWRLSDLEVSA